MHQLAGWPGGMLDPGGGWSVPQNVRPPKKLVNCASTSHRRWYSHDTPTDADFVSSLKVGLTPCTSCEKASRGDTFPPMKRFEYSRRPTRRYPHEKSVRKPEGWTENALATTEPNCVAGSCTPGPANFWSCGRLWNQVKPASPTTTSWSALRTVGHDLVPVNCSWLIFRRCQPW